MFGVVSLLTGTGYLATQDLQSHLRSVLALPPGEFIPPHITYALADTIRERGSLITRLETIASTTDPLVAQANGIGIFLGTTPVLYLPVPRTLALSGIQRSIRQAFDDEEYLIQPYYHEELWLPHITVVYGVPADQMACAAMDRLGQRSFQVTSPLLGFVLVEQVETPHPVISYEFTLRGVNRLDPNPFALTSRPCQPSDQDFVFRLVDRTLRPYMSAFRRWDEDRFNQIFLSSWQERTIVLAAGQPVGLIGHRLQPEGYLYVVSLILDPSVQHRGWGSWLLEYLENLAQNQPVRLHVWENNPAVEFYLRHGYRIVETVDNKHLMEKLPLIRSRPQTKPSR
jgi:ribosomal protein S18 acetylase RimI-like enzyme